MKSSEIRKLFLDFFRSKDHKIVSSAPIVVQNDPTLMFTNAGMNQFKDIFLGDRKPKEKRITNTQKCLRVSGKHNDLEEVGHDTYHHTMFEMLGSWSFDNYFKKDAINWAWEFLIDVCKLDPTRFYVTIFEGCPISKLERDNESFSIWTSYLPKNRILNGNLNDNFWKMGETGPCGPCSEIHYDNRSLEDRKKINGSTLVNMDHPQVIEIWNLVFMQYAQQKDGKLNDLPNFHVDTGMGLERLAMIVQGVGSNYETDVFTPLINKISSISNLKYGDDIEVDTSMRVISDHIRAISFSIADGQIPSNTKAGYVIRRILRRAVRYGYTFLNIKEPFMYRIVETLVDEMGDHFIELKSQKKLIENIIQKEEESFLNTLSQGLKKIDTILLKSNSTISGNQVFELYDTYGFPLDLTRLILKEKGITFDEGEYYDALNCQKSRSKEDSKTNVDDWTVLYEDKVEEFVGYKTLQTDVKITKYRKVIIKNNIYYHLVFNITPFYAEGGGQIGDTGLIKNSSCSIPIINTIIDNGLIIHIVDSLPKELTSTFQAQVNFEKRLACSRNHSATHLLHSSLQNILGDHVMQKGSFINDKSLRFDFSHFSKIDEKDIKNIELEVNQRILDNIELVEHANLPLSKAKDMGAKMLFSEKYEDVVRVIQFAESKELCGGTHVSSTGQIGLFKIISESSISSGVRRIEALTGISTLKYISERDLLLKEVEILVKQKNIVKGIEQLISNNKALEKTFLKINKNRLDNMSRELLSSASNINNVRCIAEIVELSANEIKNLLLGLKQEKEVVALLATKLDGKPIISVFVSDDLCHKINAVNLVNELAVEINGGGGGQPFFATAGGKKIEGLDYCLQKFKNIIKKSQLD